MEHIAQGNLIALRAFKDNRANTNLVDCGLISKVYSAFDKGVVLKVGSAGGNVVCSTTIHYPIGLHIGSVQGSSKIIINLLNGGSGWYKNVGISCLAARTPLFLFFVGRIILLLFLAVWLYVALFITVMAYKVEVILSLLFAICFDRDTSCIESCQVSRVPPFLIEDLSNNLSMAKHK
jgi:hypothetical protein